MYQAEQEKKGFSSEKNIVNELCHLVKQQSAPDIELDVFDGNLLDFHYFMTLFDEEVEKRIDDLRGRLARLVKHTSGNAKEMVKHCRGTTNYALSPCQEDTSGEIRKPIPIPWNQLNTPDVICMLLAKLPGHTRDK